MDMRTEILDLVKSIKPFDEIEKEHIEDAINWIQSDLEIFRIQKPDIPPKHLVSYFVLVDFAEKKILLMEHIKSGLWLPTGGHVEKGEHPKVTVKRECMEEIGMKPSFMNELPFFLTENLTVKMTKEHMDVSLWYVLRGDSKKPVDYQKEEFSGYKWFDYQELLQMPIEKLDAQMHRFMEKLIKSEWI